MKWSIPLGRVAGIPIRMHLTFLLLLAWIAWMGWQLNGLSSSLWALALINCLFACVVLHELGHSLVAIRFGAQVHNVTLLPIGGVASMKSIPERPYQELLVSMAGPSVNLLIAGILVVARGGLPVWPWRIDVPRSHTELLDDLLAANLVLIVFNLIPAFPMDGGRILRSLLAMILPYPKATGVATTLGQMLALGFILVGLLENPLLILIGLFVFIGAESEDRAVHIKEMLRDVLAEEVMVTDFVSLHPEDTLGRCLEYVYHHRQEDFPVLADGQLRGLLARKDWLVALHRDGVQVRVADVMKRRFVSVSPKTSVARLYNDLWLLKQGVFPVIEGGKVVGLLTAEDVGRFLIVQEAQKTRLMPVEKPSADAATSGISIDLG